MVLALNLSEIKKNKRHRNDGAERSEAKEVEIPVILLNRTDPARAGGAGGRSPPHNKIKQKHLIIDIDKNQYYVWL